MALLNRFETEESACECAKQKKEAKDCRKAALIGRTP